MSTHNPGSEDTDRDEFPSHQSILTHLAVDHDQKDDPQLRSVNYTSLLAIHAENHPVVDFEGDHALNFDDDYSNNNPDLDDAR